MSKCSYKGKKMKSKGKKMKPPVAVARLPLGMDQTMEKENVVIKPKIEGNFGSKRVDGGWNTQSSKKPNSLISTFHQQLSLSKPGALSHIIYYFDRILTYFPGLC